MDLGAPQRNGSHAEDARIRVESLNVERLPGATAWRVAFLAVQGGSSVLLFSVLAHVLPTDAFAATAVAQGVLVISQAIGDFGLSQAAVAILPARVAASPEMAADLFAGASLAYVGAGALALLLTLCAALLVPGAAMLPVAVSAPAAAATVIVSGADGILRARGEFRRPVLLMAASELGGFVGIPVAIATHSADWTCLSVSAGTTLGALGAVLVLRHLHKAASARRTAITFARASVPLGLTQVCIVLCARFDTLLAGSLAGLLAAGTFEGAWRIYQLGQYGAGAVATAAAPFLADALGARRYGEGLRLLRRLLVGVLVVGTAAGATLFIASRPLTQILAGSLAVQVADVLPTFALISPLAAVGLVAFYALISQDGQRRYVLTVHAVGAVVNLTLAVVLAPKMGVQGVVTGCAIGLAITNLLLLVRLAVVVRGLHGGHLTRSVGSDTELVYRVP